MARHNNRKITGVYCHGPQNRNVWAHVDGMGWRMLLGASDCQTETMAVMASHAYADGRSVTFDEEANKITSMYVF
mgnify:CR=1 FL=1